MKSKVGSGIFITLFTIVLLVIGWGVIGHTCRQKLIESEGDIIMANGLVRDGLIKYEQRKYAEAAELIRQGLQKGYDREKFRDINVSGILEDSIRRAGLKNESIEDEVNRIVDQGLRRIENCNKPGPRNWKYPSP